MLNLLTAPKSLKNIRKEKGNMQVLEFELQEDKNQYKYLLASVREFGPEHISKFLDALTCVMTNMKVSEKRGDEFVPIATASELKFLEFIVVTGHSEFYDTDITLFIYPFSRLCFLYVSQEYLDKEKTENEEGQERLLSENEKKFFFSTYFSELEISVYESAAKREAFEELALSIRQYIDSGFEEQCSEFNSTGCYLNLANLLLPPSKNNLPFS